jgi:redox-sensing transcriptional repressor
VSQRGQRRISESTVRRLSVYLRFLRELARQGRELVSSRQLARGCGTTPAQVRKDLSLFGSFGKRGRGYTVDELRRTLEGILGLGRRWKVALVGVGKIGSALLGYQDLARRGFDIAAAFDSDPAKTGQVISGVQVYRAARLTEIVRQQHIELGIIATPPDSAQAVADELVAAGAGAILNFAPVEIDVPDRVTVRTMDVALELEGLSFVLTSEERVPSGE